jgi:hypothetical protein
MSFTTARGVEPLRGGAIEGALLGERVGR